MSAAPPAPAGSPAKDEVDLADLLDAMIQDAPIPFLVEGRVSAGGQDWTIPATFIARDLSVVAPEPLLRDCGVFGLGRGTRDRPTPTVSVGDQATLDRSAGDYVSFVFDGELVMGGGYAHGSGEEWSWSVRDAVRVAVRPVLDSALAVHVAWAGEAAENFSGARSGVVGSAVCWVAPAQVVAHLAERTEEIAEEAKRAEAERAAAAKEALSWPTRPAPPPREPDDSHVEVVGEMASEIATFPADAYDEVVDHYDSEFGRPSDLTSGDTRQWWHSSPNAPQTLTTITRTDVVIVQTSWNQP